MAKKSPDAVGRRGFLRRAVFGAAAFGPVGAADAQRSADTDQPRQATTQVVPSDIALRVKALESLLVEKGMVNPVDIDATVDLFEHKVGPRNGARVVARAWVDAAYKKRLLDPATATQAIADLGYSGAQGEHMVVVENTPQVHNLVVCTLCLSFARIPSGVDSAEPLTPKFLRGRTSPSASPTSPLAPSRASKKSPPIARTRH